MKIGDKIIAIAENEFITIYNEYIIEGLGNKLFTIKNDANMKAYFELADFNRFFKLKNDSSIKINWLTKKEVKTFQTLETPSHYDNTNGTIYKVQKERGWNAYVFDIVKRLERAEKKGEFLSDIDKCIKVLELYRDEQGHNFKGQFEPLNK